MLHGALRGATFGALFGASGAVVVDADAGTGKYRAEHASAYAMLAAATGFEADHASAYRSLLEAGQ